MDRAFGERPPGRWLARHEHLVRHLGARAVLDAGPRLHGVVLQDDRDERRAGAAGRRDAARRSSFSLFYFASDAGERRARQPLPAAARGREVRRPPRLRRGVDARAPLPRVRRPVPEPRGDQRRHRRASPSGCRSAPAACVLPLHHPVRVAEEWSVVDNLSSGRVGHLVRLGLARRTTSSSPPENYADRKRGHARARSRPCAALWRGEAVPRDGRRRAGRRGAHLPAPRPDGAAGLDHRRPATPRRSGRPGEIGRRPPHPPARPEPRGAGREDRSSTAPRWRAGPATAARASHPDAAHLRRRRPRRGPCAADAQYRAFLDYLQQPSLGPASRGLARRSRGADVRAAPQLSAGRHGRAAGPRLRALLRDQRRCSARPSAAWRWSTGCRRDRRRRGRLPDRLRRRADDRCWPACRTSTAAGGRSELRRPRRPAAGGATSLAAQIARSTASPTSSARRRWPRCCSPMRRRPRAALAPLRRLLVGGEALPRRRWPSGCAARARRSCSTCTGRPRRRSGRRRRPRRRRRRRPVPIGRPIANTAALRPRRRGGAACPSASPASSTSAATASPAATWAGPELTAERFVPDPFGGGRARGSTAPATSRARLPDGDARVPRPRRPPGQGPRLPHRARARSRRRCARHPGVREAACVVAPAAAGDARLVAYVVPRAGARRPPAPTSCAPSCASAARVHGAVGLRRARRAAAARPTARSTAGRLPAAGARPRGGGRGRTCRRAAQLERAHRRRLARGPGVERVGVARQLLRPRRPLAAAGRRCTAGCARRSAARSAVVDLFRYPTVAALARTWPAQATPRRGGPGPRAPATRRRRARGRLRRAAPGAGDAERRRELDNRHRRHGRPLPGRPRRRRASGSNLRDGVESHPPSSPTRSCSPPASTPEAAGRTRLRPGARRLPRRRRPLRRRASSATARARPS